MTKNHKNSPTGILQALQIIITIISFFFLQLQLWKHANVKLQQGNVHDSPIQWGFSHLQKNNNQYSAMSFLHGV